MSGNLTNHIELQSFDLYNRIEQIHRQPTAAPENIRAKYILLYKSARTGMLRTDGRGYVLFRKFVFTPRLYL